MTAPTYAVGSDFLIAPRYLDRKETVQIPTHRNVYTTDAGYVGTVVLHGGRWTPLFGPEDTENAATVDVLTRAAAQLNEGE